MATRNQRMSAVKAFLEYAAGKDKSLMALYLDADVILKKKDIKVYGIEVFGESALETILAQPDKRKKNGHMYDTRARAQEMPDLKLGNINMGENNPYVIIAGKRSKTRLVPIVEKTCCHFEAYRCRFYPSGNLDEYLFYADRKGARWKMSIDNVVKFVERYGKKAHGQSQEVPKYLYP